MIGNPFVASEMLPQVRYGSDSNDLVFALVTLAVLIVSVAMLVAFARTRRHLPH